MVEHVVDVDRLALDRPLVGEHLHAVDQLARCGRSRRRSAGSARGPRRRPTVSSSCAAPRMPDSGFLISCGQHRRPARSPSARRRDGSAAGRSCRPSSAPGASTTTSPAFRQRARRRRRRASRRRGAATPRSTRYSLTAAHALATCSTVQQRAAERHEIGSGCRRSTLVRGFEEGLRGRRWLPRCCRRRRQQDRMRQRVEHGVGRTRWQGRHRLHTVHAAALPCQANNSNASARRRRTRTGSSAVRTCPRWSFKTSPETTAVSAAVSSAQPRCLRAWRRPIETP